MAPSLNIVYFAWVKERIGRGEENISLPSGVENIDQLLSHLCSLDEGYQHAFSEPEKLRFALDQNFVGIDAPLSGSDELAIFPPVTGG